jgi:hypothetical protein
MKASFTPAKAKRRRRVASRASLARRATEKVFRLSDTLASQLHQLEKAPTVKTEIAPSPGTTTLAPPPPNADVMALLFIVLMESAKSAREDLKAIMEGVKAINKAKQEWRSVLGLAATDAAADDSDASFQVVAALYAGHVTTRVRALRRDLEAMTEMGEKESLQMQMAMDRLTRLMSTLSNLLKRLADAASQISRNLK